MQRLWDLAHALDVASKRMARTLGVTGPQRLVVRIIGQAPRATASEIAATLGIHPSTLTGILARLTARGLVRRAVDRADRRRARFSLTAAGQRINATSKGTIEAVVRRVLARTPPGSVATTTELVAALAAELVAG
jgi:MarR family transcriptional regulator, organic hydroperoxide resistance regulator